MSDPVTLTMERATASDLLFRLLETPMRDGDEHEWFLIVLLSDALGHVIPERMRKRAAVFA